jgi:hypothetical protein
MDPGEFVGISALRARRRAGRLPFASQRRSSIRPGSRPGRNTSWRPGKRSRRADSNRWPADPGKTPAILAFCGPQTNRRPSFRIPRSRDRVPAWRCPAPVPLARGLARGQRQRRPRVARVVEGQGKKARSRSGGVAARRRGIFAGRVLCDGPSTSVPSWSGLSERRSTDQAHDRQAPPPRPPTACQLPRAGQGQREEDEDGMATKRGRGLPCMLSRPHALRLESEEAPAGSAAASPSVS